MPEEPRYARSIKVKSSVLRKAHHSAIDAHKTLSKWLEEAIEEKVVAEAKEKAKQK